MADSTPEASGEPSSSAIRSSRQPEATTAASSLLRRSSVVELTDGLGAEVLDDLGHRVAERLLLR